MGREPKRLADVVDRVDELRAALAELRATIDADDELGEVLQDVTRQVIAVIPGAIASITILRDGEPETAACSDRRVADIDAEQYAAGDGPCLLAARTRHTVRVTLEQGRQRWPAFAASAERAGVAGYLASPLLLDSELVGSLNLYRDRKSV